MTSVLCFVLGFWVTSTLGVCWAETFCVSNDEKMQEALSLSASNGEDDVIQIVAGSQISDFSLSNEIGYSLTVMGGYNEDCTIGIEVPKQGGSTEELGPAAGDEHAQDSIADFMKTATITIPKIVMPWLRLRRHKKQVRRFAFWVGDVCVRIQAPEPIVMEAGVPPKDIEAMVEDITRMTPNQQEERPEQLAVKP